MPKEFMSEQDKRRVIKPGVQETAGPRATPDAEPAHSFASLQQTLGNQAVQRLLAQRSGDEPFDLDDETAGRIARERGGGQPLDAGVAAQMGRAVGADFSGVRVHTDGESDALNRDLSARAFTTGHDVFFRSGAYEPASSAGQELIAHELAHVVQQGTGAVSSPGGRMRVNAAGDRFEQQADAVAHSLAGPAGPAAGVQRQTEEEEEEEVQMQAAEEEEEEVQMQEEEEEETVQAQELEEEEELT